MRAYNSLVIGCGEKVKAHLNRTFECLRIPAPRVCESVEDARELIGRPDLDLVFADLEQADEVLDALSLAPGAARLVLVGDQLPARRAFEFARRGVDAWLEDDPNVEEVLIAIEEALSGPSQLQRVAAANLGRHGLKEAQNVVRTSMIEEALTRTRGNRHAAARLLQVDRRAVQLALKDMEDQVDSDWIASLTAANDGDADALRQVVLDRVNKHSEQVVEWRELPVQSLASVKEVFGRIAFLTSSEPINLVIDLSRAQLPSAAVRASLREHFGRIPGLRRVSVAIGDNLAMGFAARMVLAESPDCIVTLHETFEQAVADAAQTSPSSKSA